MIRSIQILLPLVVALASQETRATGQPETVSAEALLRRINAEESVRIHGKRIVGDLDFTALDNKYPGGSYGVRIGRVREIFTKLKSPLHLEDCVIDGAIITFTEERKRLLLKENFVAFDGPLILRRCRFLGPVTFERLTFYNEVVIEDCVFEKPVRIEKVRFIRPPTIGGNRFVDGIVHRDSNWSPIPDQPRTAGAETPKDGASDSDETDISIVLKNPSSRSVAIQFGKDRWNLSPHGSSTLRTAPGTSVYLLRNGKKDRLLLTVTPDIAGKTVDVTRP